MTTYLSLRHRARTLWPDHLPSARRNRTQWLRAIARLGDKWLLAAPIVKGQA